MDSLEKKNAVKGLMPENSLKESVDNKQVDGKAIQ